MRALSLILALALTACTEGNTANPAKPAAPTTSAPVASGGAPEGARGASSAALPASGGGDGMAATWEGGAIPFADLNKEMATQVARMQAEYLTQRYEAEVAALDEKINTAIIQAEVKARGLADERALMKIEVEDKASEPTEAEIQEAYAQLARRLGGKPLEEVRDKVTGMVRQRNQGERAQVFIGELRKKYNVNVLLPYPELPRIPVGVDDDPFEGNAEAKVTIIQFAEYQCPYCGRARESIQQVMKAYEGKVRFVFRDFPLSFHERAIPAAVAANCADKQGKYWPYHDLLMANQRALEDADLERAATQVGLNLSDWNACRQDPAMKAEVEKDMADGAAAGVSGTPAFFINGIFLSGAQPFEKFKTIIDRELAAG